MCLTIFVLQEPEDADRPAESPKRILSESLAFSDSHITKRARTEPFPTPTPTQSDAIPPTSIAPITIPSMIYSTPARSPAAYPASPAPTPTDRYTQQVRRETREATKQQGLLLTLNTVHIQPTQYAGSPIPEYTMIQVPKTDT